MTADTGALRPTTGPERIPPSIEMRWQDLYEETQRVLLGLSFAAGWLVAIDASRRGQIPTGLVLASLFLMAGPLASLVTLSNKPDFSRRILIFMIALAAICFISVSYKGYMSFTLVLVFIACSGMMSSAEHTILGLFLGAGLMVIRRSLPPGADSSALLPATLLMVGATVCSWLSRRPLFLALSWASQSTSLAIALNAELRERQLVLNRTLRAMDEANERLAHMNQRLAEARLLAEHARQAKGRFAATISHELRTPLNLIVGFAQVMYSNPQAYADVQVTPEFMLDLGVVYRNAVHLQRLVDDVLDLAELEMGRMAIQPESADMVTLTQEALVTVDGLVRLRGLTLVTELPDGPLPVYVDRTRIRQVLLNLLTNAARYTEKGSITVRLHSDETWVTCEVIDTGPGIAAEDRDRLFQEFQRVRTGTTAGRGTGLGLAISKQFVQAHGGEIWVESEPGRGSLFGFRLPRSSGVVVAHALGEQSGRPSAAGPRMPLVAITQSLTAGRLLTRIMQRFHVTVVHDSIAALSLIATQQPPALLVDAALGEQPVRELRERLAVETQGGSGQPHIVSVPLPTDEARLLGRCVHGYLAKPIAREALLAILRAEGADAERVLIVDDDEDLLRLLAHHIEDAARPYRVVTARNGREALQRLQEHPMDLILLDLVMPVMDGYRFLAEIEEQGLDVPVIVISGQDALAPETRLGGEIRLHLGEEIGSERLLSSLEVLLAALAGRTIPGVGRG